MADISALPPTSEQIKHAETMKNNFIHSVVARRIFGLFVICALLPVGALALFSLKQVTATVKEESRTQLHHASKNAGMTIMEVLYLLETELRSYSFTVTEMSQVEVRSLLQSGAKEGEKRFLALTIFSEKGRDRSLLGRPCPLPPLSLTGPHHPGEEKAVLYQTKENKKIRLFLAVPVPHTLADGAVLVAEINPAYIWTLARNSLPPETDLSVIDSHGKPLYTTAQSYPAFLSRVKAQLPDSSVGHFEWHTRSEAALVDFWTAFLTPLYQTEPWIIITSRDSDDAFRSVHLFGRTFLLVIALALVIVIYLSSVQIRRSLIPLTTLRSGAQQLSKGNLDARVTLNSADEFQELADTFNGMADHLQRQFSTLREMNQIAQSIFSSHDLTTLIQAALSSQKIAIPCQIMCLSLFDPTNSSISITYRIHTDDYGCDRLTESVTLFSDQDLQLLRNTFTSLYCSETSQYSSLLSPLAEKGARFFYLFPFHRKDLLAGILTIGYHETPPLTDEDLTRTRKIADEVAAALDNMKLIEELNQLTEGTIRTLANTVDAKSPWTAGHSVRVTQLALAISEGLGLSERERETLYLGSMLHDLGKIGVPETILDKNGPLSDEEYFLIQKHAGDGARILEPIRAYEKIIPIVAQHHEQFNGSGYPNGLAGNEISLGARILSVADVYDALISDRPYRRGWEKARVLKFLQEKAGSQFDPEIVDALLKIADKLPSALPDTDGGFTISSDSRAAR